MGNPSIAIGRLVKTVGTFVVCVGLTASVHAQNKVLEQLEAGRVISGRSGSAVLVQSIVKKDASSVFKSISGDMRKLPSVFGQVAFARPFTTKDGKRLVYMKLRGLGDGTAVLMEMKEGPREAFTNARELLKSSDFGTFREAAKTELNEVGDLGLLTDISKANQSGQAQRMLGGDNVILLEGPINKVQQMPNLRVTVQLSVAPYTVVPAATGIPGAPAPMMQSYSLLQVRAAFGTQAPLGGELGDYRGFGERQMSIARVVAEDVVKSVKARLERI